MRYTVIWTPEAENQLAAVWMAAADPAAVTRAAERVELLLANDPLARGQEFYGDLLLAARTIHVVSLVDQPSRTVTVTMVW